MCSKVSPELSLLQVEQTELSQFMAEGSHSSDHLCGPLDSLQQAYVTIKSQAQGEMRLSCHIVSYCLGSLYQGKWIVW